MHRLQPFSYSEPATLQEAVQIASAGERATRFLAGGTDLIVRMKRGEITPSALVNLKRIKGLNGIEREPNKGIRIGALAKVSEIERSRVICSSHPVLVQAAGLLGSPSIRNLATVGGNLGRASPASDLTPSLMVLRARVSVEGPLGAREIAVDQLFSEPGKSTLSPAEVMTSFFIPDKAPHTGAVYLRLGRRSAADCVLVGVAVLLTLSDKATQAAEANVALASVGPIPLRARRAEEVLRSGPLTEGRIRQAAEAAAEDASPIDDMRASSSYRREMVKVLAYRAILQALGRAREQST